MGGKPIDWGASRAGRRWERAGSGTPGPLQMEFVLAERRDDVREHVRDLVPHGQKNHDNDDRNENQDQGILDHSLAALAAIKPAIHGNYLLSRNASV